MIEIPRTGNHEQKNNENKVRSRQMVGSISRAWLLTCSLVTIFVLSGCEEEEKTDRHSWDGYNPPINPHCRGDAVKEQIAALKSDIEDIEADKGIVPPGYYAQLGLLYFSLGKSQQLSQRAPLESDPFSDSVAYMNALMRHAKPARVGVTRISVFSEDHDGTISEGQ